MLYRVCSWLATNFSVSHSVLKEQMEVTMTCSGKLLDGPESGPSVDEDITPKACRMNVTEDVP